MPCGLKCSPAFSRPICRGVKLLAGTDASWGGAMPFFGVSLHWELEHLVEAGLPPLDVLRIATQHAAEALGAQERPGDDRSGQARRHCVAGQKLPDDIENTQSIWRVLKDGWLFDPDELLATRRLVRRSRGKWSLTIMRSRIAVVALAALIVYSQGHIPGASETALAASASAVPPQEPMTPLKSGLLTATHSP